MGYVSYEDFCGQSRSNDYSFRSGRAHKRAPPGYAMRHHSSTTGPIGLKPGEYTFRVPRNHFRAFPELSGLASG
jgi:hypothetical protein